MPKHKSGDIIVVLEKKGDRVKGTFDTVDDVQNGSGEISLKGRPEKFFQNGSQKKNANDKEPTDDPNKDDVDTSDPEIFPVTPAMTHGLKTSPFLKGKPLSQIGLDLRHSDRVSLRRERRQILKS